MANKKRSNNSHHSKGKKQRKQGEDDENPRQLDPVFGQYRALPISIEKLNSVTPDTIPEDGETYLAMVRKQAESGSSVMFIQKEIDYDEGSSSTTNSKSNIEAEVVRNTSDEYAKHLDEILEIYERERSKLPETGSLPIPASFKFPNNFTEWRRFVMTNKPETALISNFDHPLTIRLIIYSTKWLNANIPDQVSQWIYALLIKVSELLEGTDVAVLRDMALRAKKIHERSDLSDSSKFTTEFILVIVARFFGQRDLDI